MSETICKQNHQYPRKAVSIEKIIKKIQRDGSILIGQRNNVIQQLQQLLHYDQVLTPATGAGGCF